MNEDFGVELKNTVYAQDVRNLASILADYHKAKRYVLCRCDQSYEEEGILFFPFTQGIETIFKENDSPD